MTFTEKYGLPFLLGKQPRNTEKSDTNSLLDSLEKMLTDTMAVVPDDSSVSFLEGSKSYSSDVYKKFLEFCNSEISKAILSQTLTTEIQGSGTYAASKTHFEVYDLLIQGDKRLVEKTLNKLIATACGLNFASVAVSELPSFELYEESDVKATLAERDTLLQKQGVQFTAAYYQRYYNLKDDEFRL
jgi:phage gp29-like protein